MKVLHFNERLKEVSTHCSERERRAEQAERESLLWKKIVFMRDKVDREFDAYVTGVASFGVFVTLKDYFVEGLVPITALGNDFFVYEEKQHRLRGRSSGQTFRLGDSLRVRLVAIDEVRRSSTSGSPVRRPGAHGAETLASTGSGRCGAGTAPRFGLWTDGSAASAEKVAMRRAPVSSLAVLLIAVAACRHRGVPNPDIRMAVSHEPAGDAPASPQTQQGRPTARRPAAQAAVPEAGRNPSRRSS
jgi:hypothetical protein